MPREIITLQIGQCGIQLGTRLWDLTLREHSAHTKNGCFDDALSTFFRNVDNRFQDREIPVGNGTSKIRSLRARAVLIDMEEGVLSQVMRTPLAELFDANQFIRDCSGSGNNWATGHYLYGSQYGDTILDSIRRVAECCDSLQSFFLIHSLGGGTGSGLGTYVLRMVEDAFPEVYRFTTAVFPSKDDDVITSPYNSVLSASELIQHADCVLPIENQALLDIVARSPPPEPPPMMRAPSRSKISSALAQLAQPKGRSQKKGSSSSQMAGSASSSSSSSSLSAADASPFTSVASEPVRLIAPPRADRVALSEQKSRAFDDMNTVGAHLLSNLTCSIRFSGPLNVDLNEISMNLVPYPRLHFLIPSIAPVSLSMHTPSVIPQFNARSVDQTFNDAFSGQYQLIKADCKHSTYLACGLISRGNIQISDINRNVNRLKAKLDMVHWNTDGFKIGLCSVPPVGLSQSVLLLANNTCISETLAELRARFMKLYTRKAHLHHYTEYMDPGAIDFAAQTLSDTIEDYSTLRTPSKSVQKGHG